MTFTDGNYFLLLSRAFRWMATEMAEVNYQVILGASPAAVGEIVFAEVIDHRSRVKMIHHRPTVYTYRPEMLS